MLFIIICPFINVYLLKTAV